MKKNYIIGSFFVVLGLSFLIISFLMILADKWFIDMITSSLASGANPLYFQKYANGILAGGVIKFIPFEINIIVSIMGVIFSYYGTYVLVNSSSETAIKDMFTRRYWLEYQAKLAYKDRSLSSKKFIKKKGDKKEIKGPIKKRKVN